MQARFDQGFDPSIPRNPIKSVYIVRDGLPVFHKEFGGASRNDNGTGGKPVQDEMLVSGFLSALSDFMGDMKAFGDMRELRTSTNTKFSFLKQDSLLFVACSDDTISHDAIQAFLKRLSMKFLGLYSKHLSGRNPVVNMRDYQGFDTILQREVLQENIRALGEARRVLAREANIPRLEVPLERLLADHYFKGVLPEKILPLVDGQKTIDEIANESGLDRSKVEGFLKSMVKEGFLTLV